MKKRLIVVGLLLGIIAVVLFAYVRFPQSGNVNSQKIFEAAQTYTRILKTQRRPIPESINLRELIELRLLQASDVSGLSGANVTISLTANPNDANAVLLRAKFPDGQEMLVRGDGSIQSR